MIKSSGYHSHSRFFSLRFNTVYRSVALLLLILFLSIPVIAQDKRPLTIDDFIQWKRITQQKLSDDGRWLVYNIAPQEGDGKLTVRNLDTGIEHEIERGDRPLFTDNNNKLVYLIIPPKDKDNKPDKNIKNKLGIMELFSGNVRSIDRISDFKVSDDGLWVAYKMPAPEKSESEKKEETKSEKKTGTDVILLYLGSGYETHYSDVMSYSFDENSRFFLYSVSSQEDQNDGLFAKSLKESVDYVLAKGTGKYQDLTWDDNAENLAFVSDREFQDMDEKERQWKIYHWKTGGAESKVVAEPGVARGFPEDMKIAKSPSLLWSKNSKSLFFNIQEIPAAEDTTIKKSDLPDVDVWHWKDVVIQTQQAKRLNSLQNVSYRSVAHLAANSVVRLADEQIRTVNISPNSILAVGGDVNQYEYEQPWRPTWQDVYLINIADGVKTQIKQKHRGRVSWSNAGKYLYWFEDKDWYIYSIKTGQISNLTEKLDIELRNTLNDRPTVLGAWGSAGWTEDDEGLLVYDQYDIWYVPVEDGIPENITGGEGRRRDGVFRYFTLDNDEEFIDLDKPLLLSFTNNRTKAQGYYRLRNGSGNPIKLIELDKKISRPVKAENADLLLFNIQSFEEFPDLHISGTDFKDVKKVTDANPQQSEYLWGSDRLIEWYSTDGKKLQGVLHLPANYEPGRRYPMVLYIYERMASRLHTYYEPLANHRFNATVYTSNGYAVLMPDIVYEKGIPGPSSVRCLVPAVQKVVDMGIADPERVGLQGHSWGGYESAYIITQTNIFRAVCSGAPVSNMTSAYGGIRWGSGNPRTFQYETGQSRIGGNLWDYPELYIQNSPLFFADRVETPLLIMHGDKDDAVPWYQAIEYFLALRRLNKPVWFLQYNDEPHHLQKKKNKYDFTRRMWEFYEHFLMDKPMPEWMEKGVSITDKGRK